MSFTPAKHKVASQQPCARKKTEEEDRINWQPILLPLSPPQTQHNKTTRNLLLADEKRVALGGALHGRRVFTFLAVLVTIPVAAFAGLAAVGWVPVIGLVKTFSHPRGRV